MTILETKSRIDPMKEYIPTVIRSINQNFAPKTIQIPLSNGESFFANGHVQRIPRGEVDARFTPRRGTVNATTSPPASPVKVPAKSARVPRGVGLMVVVDYVEFLANLQATQEVVNLVQKLNEFYRIRTAEQDFELMDDTLTAIQIKPQEVGARLRAKCLTKTATATTKKTTRIRGWSRL